MAATARLDALVGLSAYGFENPTCTQAVIVADEVVLEAIGLGHPLLPEDECVRNDVQLDASTPLLLVSGSNMSGKSTLLRAVGVNVVLGLAGLPVRAERLVLSPFTLGASIQIHDSLRAGRSHFEAELRQLAALDRLSRGDRPLLYLLDELLAGTNSHDRAVGAEAILKALTARGALGLVTTHDLALTVLADRLTPPARNVHFRDHVQAGRMAFDYRLRPGVVPRGNALALMRVLGFEV
jgi:DNA mismatch repair ATPase MutS